MRQGKIEPLKHQLLMPYENHLKDIVEIASGIQQPSHTTGNSIRHVSLKQYVDLNIQKRT